MIYSVRIEWCCMVSVIGFVFARGDARDAPGPRPYWPPGVHSCSAPASCAAAGTHASEQGAALQEDGQ